jgi:hypothetical protein
MTSIPGSCQDGGFIRYRNLVLREETISGPPVELTHRPRNGVTQDSSGSLTREGEDYWSRRHQRKAQGMAGIERNQLGPEKYPGITENPPAAGCSVRPSYQAKGCGPADSGKCFRRNGDPPAALIQNLGGDVLWLHQTLHPLAWRF